MVQIGRFLAGIEVAHDQLVVRINALPSANFV
jgi:hypothetical protein